VYIFNFNKILVFHLIAIDLHQAKENMYLYTMHVEEKPCSKYK